MKLTARWMALSLSKTVMFGVLIILFFVYYWKQYWPQRYCQWWTLWKGAAIVVSSRWHSSCRYWQTDFKAAWQFSVEICKVTSLREQTWIDCSFRNHIWSKMKSLLYSIVENILRCSEIIWIFCLFSFQFLLKQIHDDIETIQKLNNCHSQNILYENIR